MLTRRPTSHLTITLQLAQDYESSSDAVVVRHYRVTSSHGKVLLAFVWPHAYYTGNGSHTTPLPFRAGEIVDLDVLNANYERLAFAIVTIK